MKVHTFFFRFQPGCWVCSLLLLVASPAGGQNAVLKKDGVVVQEWEVTAVAETARSVGDAVGSPLLQAPDPDIFLNVGEAEEKLATWLAGSGDNEGRTVLAAALARHRGILADQIALLRDLQENGLPLEIVDRQKGFVDRIREALNLEELLAADLENGRTSKQAVRDRLQELLSAPESPPMPGPRVRVDKKAAPLLTRAQADQRLEQARAEAEVSRNQAKFIRSIPQYRTETPEIQFTAAIRAKAIELGNDPLAMANFVRNEITFQPYLGSRKGAAYTLDQGAGNDTDQASLLMALLRVSGIPARYGKATCEISAEAAASWLGVDSPAAAAGLLTTAGLDGVAINGPGGIVTRVSFTHTWVEAYLPFSNYRGRGSSDSGRTWVRFSPSFHASAITPGLPVIDALNPDPDNYLLSFSAVTRSELPLDLLASQLEAQASTRESVIERRHEIIPQDLPLLPASLPMDVLGEVTHQLSLSNQDRYRVRLNLSLGGQVLDYTSNLSDLAGKNVRIDWSAASAADQTTIDAYGGLYSTPPNLVQLRPSLIVDGTVVAGPGLPVGMGRTVDFSMSFFAPAGASNSQPVVSNTMEAGNNQAISFDTFLDEHRGLESGSPVQEDLFDSFLHQTANEYLQRVNDAFRRGERLLRVRTTQDVSEAIVGNQVAVGLSFGTPVSFKWDGLFVDADRRIVGPFSVDNDNAKSRRFMIMTGMEGSNLEDKVFSDGYKQAAVSTIRILQLASEANIPICTITTSIAAQCPGFSHPASVRSAVNSALARGNTVIIPRDPMTIGQWRGTGYVDMEHSGAAGWIISGGINGSVKTPAGGATVERWPIIEPCDATSVDGVIVFPPADAPDPRAIFCADETKLTFEASLTFTCEDGQVITQPKSLPFQNTKKRLGGGEYTIDLIAFGAPPRTIRHFTIVELKDLKVSSEEEPMNSVLASSGETLTVSETAGMSSAKILIDGIAAPELPKNAGYLLWKVEGDSASPKTGSFANAPVTVELDTSSDNREFVVKAGCDDNQNGSLEDGEVTQTVNVRVSCVKLDIDVDGDGSITDDDDDPVETSKGGLVCANVDDDNDDDVADRTQTTVMDEDDLEPINLGFTSASAPTSGTLKLEATSGAGRIKIWTSPTKGTPVGLPKTWTLGTDPIPATLYVEGIAGSDTARDVKLKLTYEDGATMCDDEIALTVVELKVHNVHEMADIDAAVLQTTEKVALQTSLKAEIKPASTTNGIKWTIGGGAIKSYFHDIDEPKKHKTDPLKSADLAEAEVSYFWTTVGMPHHTVTLEVTPEGFSRKCQLEIEFEVKQHDDPSMAFYCNRGKMPDPVYPRERVNPNGPGGEIYQVLNSHDLWHKGQKMADGKDPVFSTNPWGNGNRRYEEDYNGEAFLGWHREFLEAHAEWRKTFSLSASFPVSPDALAQPDYLKIAPAGNGSDFIEPGFYRFLSDVHGYARRGEFQTRNELGIGMVNPWHNRGHSTLRNSTGDGIMTSNSSPSTIEETFWKWHGQIESVHATWRVDKASVSGTYPLADQNLRPFTEVTVVFSRPVSCERYLNSDQRMENNIALKPGALKVGGSPATMVRDEVIADGEAGPVFRTYIFSGFTLPPAGDVDITLSGTASYESHSWSVTVTP